ncbi:MAG: phosphodiester glycosidase family protein [Clostridia bacterium]|nr:phosphodiester glycosidase family protein [Clostridia bacterium]
MKKKCLVFLCILCFITSVFPVYAQDLSITVAEETPIHGVTYRHIQKLFDNGWQDLHILQADLTQPYLKFDVLSNENGKSYLQNTYDSAVNADAVAAINADFFASKSGQYGRGSAIGLEITDGVLRTSPAAYESMNALYQLAEDDTLYFNPFTFSCTVTAPDGTTAPVTVLNKYDSMTGIVMYTADWGEITPGSEGNVLEIVVQDGKVTAKNRDVGPVTIPKDGYVLASDLSMHTFLDDFLEEGSTVVLNMTTAPNYELIETAVGGGGMLLVEGKVPDSFSHTISGTHPRSAVGVDRSGTTLTLVAVDGRRSAATGMTMTQLGYLMAELGCYNAMNLDGGGSTLMTVKQDDGSQKVVNTPSDGGKRPVTNSIGVVTENMKKSVFSAVRLKSDGDTVFSGTSVSLSLEKLDQYGRVMESVSPDKIKWTVKQGKGSVQNNCFYPTAPGKALLKAESGGFYDEIALTVLDEPHRLDFTTKEIALNSGKSTTLWLTGRDGEGRTATIYPRDVKITVLNPAVATVSENTVKARKAGSTIITASLNDVAANMCVSVDGATPISVPKGAARPDPSQTSATLTDKNSFQFTVFGNTRTPEKFFDIYIMNGAVNAVQKASDLNFFVGNNVNSSLLTALGNNKVTADSYSEFTKNGSTFITLKNASGGSLYGYDKTQWSKLQKTVNNLSGGNLFVFLNDHNLSSLDVEITVFKKLMESAAARGCNVYVFAGGFVNETEIENGVRYITTAGVFPSIGLKPPATNLSYIKYYLVTVNGNQVTYETRGITKAEQ